MNSSENNPPSIAWQANAIPCKKICPISDESQLPSSVLSSIKESSNAMHMKTKADLMALNSENSVRSDVGPCFEETEKETNSSFLAQNILEESNSIVNGHAKKVTFQEPVVDNVCKETRADNSEKKCSNDSNVQTFITYNKGDTISRDTTSDDETITDVTQDDAEIVRNARIQESITIMKSNAQYNAKQMSEISGWTQEMDEKLLTLSSDCQYDFDFIAVSMANNFSSDIIEFDKDVCHRRWCLLDLAEENDSPEDFVFPSAEKCIASFANVTNVNTGKRKSFDELRMDSKVSAVLPEDLPSTETWILKEEVDDEKETPRIIDRGDLWEMLEVSSIVPTVEVANSLHMPETDVLVGESAFDELD